MTFGKALCDRHASDAFDETGWGADGLYAAQVFGPWVAGPEYGDQGRQPGGAHLLTSPASADVHVGLTIPCLVQTGDIVMVRYVWVERQQDPYDVQGHTAHLYYRAVPVGPLPPAVAAIYEPRGRAVFPVPENGITEDDICEALHGDDLQEMAAQNERGRNTVWEDARSAVAEMIADAGGISEEDRAWARNALGVRPPTSRTITSEDVADAEEQMDADEARESKRGRRIGGVQHGHVPDDFDTMPTDGFDGDE